MKPSSPIWKLLEFYGTRIHHRGKWRVHQVLRNMLHATCDCDLEVERQGLRWCLNPSDFVQTHLYWIGEYEHLNVQHLSRWLRPGAVVFDVGANFGYYSLMMASAVQDSGQVFAFEPAETAYHRLQKNISLNNLQSRIAAIRCGLSDIPGNSFVNEMRGNSGAAAISAEPTGEPVRLDTLDGFCMARQISRIDIIKIDVEGSELKVLKGGKKMLAGSRPVVMLELNADALAKEGTSTAEVARMLQSWEYQLLVGNRKRLVPLQTLPGHGQVENVFCIPKTRAEPYLRGSNVA